MSSFFLTGDSRRNKALKRRKPPVSNGEAKLRKKVDEEIESSDEEGFGGNDRGKEGYESDEEPVTDINQLAFRKAKELLNKLRDEKDGDDDDVEQRLRDQVAASMGKAHRNVASLLHVTQVTCYRKHRFSVVCACFSPCGRFIVSAGKESSIVKYDLEEGKMVGTVGRTTEGGHKGKIFSLAISPNGKHLVSGGEDAILRIWRLDDLSIVKSLRGHKSPITALAFQFNSSHLFSSGHDRSIKVWDMDQLGCIDTLFGHQDGVTGLVALSRYRVVSSGGQDKSIRLWKIEDESHLVFNGPATCVSMDCVCLLNEDHFVSGSSDGSLCLWSVLKKKPTYVEKEAHGEGRWIVSVAALPYSDLALSGSNDGRILFWKIADDYKSMNVVQTIQCAGFINSLSVCPRTGRVAVSIGQEHRLGRWWKETTARNEVRVLQMKGVEQALSLSAI